MSDYIPALGEFQPPDVEEDRDVMAEAWLLERERAGYLVLTRDEFNERLDSHATDAYAEGRIDEAEDIAKELLPGLYYMDPPDGGSASLREQLHRMSEDAARYRWLRANTTDQVPYRGWWQIAGGAGADPSRLDAAIDAERLNQSAAPRHSAEGD